MVKIELEFNTVARQGGPLLKKLSVILYVINEG